MRPDIRRNFRLDDGLILVAATAVGLAASRAIIPEELTLQGVWAGANNPPQGIWTPMFIAQSTAELASIAVIPSLAVWTPTCLLMGLRGPRPPWRRLSRQPGMMACLIATLAMVLSVSVSLSRWITTGQEFNMSSWIGWQIGVGSILTGLAVFWCWMTMMLSGRCRPEPSWLDRLCRLVGSAWLVLGIIFVIANIEHLYL
jgi:hypothetical protein